MIDDELRALISAEPSPDFVARVRARIDQETPRRAWVPQAMLAAAALLLIALAVALPRVMRNDVTRQPRIALRASPVAHDVTALAEAIDPSRPLLPQRLPRASDKARTGVPREIPGTPRLKIPQLNPAETRALQRLFASGVDVPIELPAAQDDRTDHRIVFEAVAIEPLRFETITEGARR